MTFEQWFKDNMIIDDSIPNAPRVVFYTKQDIRDAWVAAEKATIEYLKNIPKCDHIVGMNGNEDIAEIIRKSRSFSDDNYRFNYCADCGSKLR